jgi:hypothetical protein
MLPHYITNIQQSQFYLSQYDNKHTTTILPTYIQPQTLSQCFQTTYYHNILPILPQYYHIHGHGQGHGHGHGSMARNSILAKVGLHAIRPCTILDCTQLCVYDFTYIWWMNEWMNESRISALLQHYHIYIYIYILYIDIYIYIYIYIYVQNICIYI